MKIKKGDTVIAISGADKGKEGVVLHAFPKTRSILVEGMNIRTHFVRASQGKKGSMDKKPTKFPVSRVMVKDPKGGKGTRITMKVVAGKKTRVAQKSGQELK